MFFKKLLLLFLWIKVATSSNQGFIFNGFSLQLVSGQEQSLELGGMAELRTDGLFRLTDSSTFQVGHVFYSVPFKFKSSPNANAFSFSTTFVFVIVPENSRGHGITFVLAPSKEFGQVAPGQHLGLFNFSTDGLSSNHIVAIEFDTFQNQEFADIDDNHVGVDINSLKSAKSVSAGYVYNKTGKYRPADLSCGDRMQVWVEYDGSKHQLNVTLSPVIRRRDLLKTADPELNKDFAAEEIDLVLKLALLCSHTIAAYRPRMSQVISYLNGQASLPEDLDKILHTQELLEQSRDYSLTWTKDSVATMAVTESFLFAGR
ncbi:hypothetical protein QUC31_011330 [Theobroma cacao]